MKFVFIKINEKIISFPFFKIKVKFLANTCCNRFKMKLVGVVKKIAIFYILSLGENSLKFNYFSLDISDISKACIFINKLWHVFFMWVDKECMEFIFIEIVFEGIFCKNICGV